MERNYKEDIEQLIIDQLTGEISSEDSELLIRFINEDEEVKELYGDYAESFRGAKAATFLSKIDQNAAWNKINSVMTPEVEMPKTVKFINLKRWLVAASVLLPLAIVTVFVLRNYFSKDQQFQFAQNKDNVKLILTTGESVALDQIAQNKTLNTATAVLHNEQGALKYESKGQQHALNYNTLIVPRTKDYKIKLSDGTEVWLNSDSELKFPLEFGDENRIVYLKGEAYFKVTKNAEKPFIVKVNDVDVQVLGTSFNVNSYFKEALKVALVEGSVKLNAHGEESLLKPGLMATYTTGIGFTQNWFDDQQELSWMNGIYFFNNADIKEIAEIVQRWYDVRIEIADSSVQSVKISGAIEKDKPLKQFLENLTITSRLQYTINDNNTVVLSKQR
ncbi:FecR family protein [Solitalea lacus]|uniref:FecR family protein n=1 Tax=Solitalea lacus TaxID=2911172 RepID=UPI001EDB5CE1|nr:FecR domain-containing protein [Solitalea lacus]UKJ07681.1 FecR domain-containing protein [Solitalea lacus]